MEPDPISPTTTHTYYASGWMPTSPTSSAHSTEEPHVATTATASRSTHARPAERPAQTLVPLQCRGHRIAAARTTWPCSFCASSP